MIMDAPVIGNLRRLSRTDADLRGDQVINPLNHAICHIDTIPPDANGELTFHCILPSGGIVIDQNKRPSVISAALKKDGLLDVKTGWILNENRWITDTEAKDNKQFKYNAVDMQKLRVKELTDKEFLRLSCYNHFRGCVFGWTALHWNAFHNGEDFGDCVSYHGSTDRDYLHKRSELLCVRQILISRCTQNYGTVPQQNDMNSMWNMYRVQIVFLTNQLILRRDGHEDNLVSSWDEICPEDPVAFVEVPLRGFKEKLDDMTDDYEGRKRANYNEWKLSTAYHYWAIPKPYLLYERAVEQGTHWQFMNLHGQEFDFYKTDTVTQRRMDREWNKEVDQCHAQQHRRRLVVYGLDNNVVQWNKPVVDYSYVHCGVTPEDFQTKPLHVNKANIDSYLLKASEDDSTMEPPPGDHNFYPTLQTM